MQEYTRGLMGLHPFISACPEHAEGLVEHPETSGRSSVRVRKPAPFLMNGFVYILQSETSSRYYIGSSNHPARRLSQHNSGLVSSTRNKGPWKIVALLGYPTEMQSRRVEYYLKKQKSRKTIALVIAGIYSWPDGLTPIYLSLS